MTRIHSSKSHISEQGFTLLELLIAMGLTSILGLVLFSTYRMILSYGQEASVHVMLQEEKRQFNIILDNDLANITYTLDETSPIQKRSFVSFKTELLLDATGSNATGSNATGNNTNTAGSNTNTTGSNANEIELEIDNTTDDDTTLLLAFITHNSLHEHSDFFTSPPVYVEYIQRKGQNGFNIFRRERSFAYLKNYANVSEILYLRNVKDFEAELLFNQEFHTEWDNNMTNGTSNNNEDDEDESIEAVRITITHMDNQTNTYLVPIIE